MNQRMSTFQAAALGVFGLAIVAGIIFFATSANFNNADDIGEVVIWGTLDRQGFETAFTARQDTDRALLNVTYIEKDPATFDAELSEALAAGRGPDLFLLQQDAILRHEAKVIAFPYSSFMPLQRFKDTFIDEAELYLKGEGALGMPLLIDPLVLYWNKEMLAAGGFSKAPQDWDEVYTMAERLSSRDGTGNIARSTIAFGEFENVRHAKDIVSTLIMQAGGSVVRADSEGRLSSALSQAQDGASERPAISALRFYSSFADPSESVYSWNRSEPDSLEAFARSELALYVGYASERPLIMAQNPNLKFDVAPLPQAGGTARVATFGHLYALAIPRTAGNVAGAVAIAGILIEAPFAEELARAFTLPSVRRDLLAESADGPMLVFRNAALVARGWLDPGKEQTDAIFKRMIEGVSSGSARLSEAVDRAGQSLNSLLQ